MVKRYKKLSKYGFTLIELIFAIVIIGITVVSLPMMSQVISKGVDENLKQEAIFAASAELMNALGGYWDERSMEDANKSDLARVIDIDSDCNATTRLRPGHINQKYHRRCLDSPNNSGLDQTSRDDVFSLDDANGTRATYINISNDASGYEQTDLNTTIEVTRSDNNKTITATLKDHDGNIITLLRAISTNIGETNNYYRTF